MSVSKALVAALLVLAGFPGRMPAIEVSPYLSRSTEVVLGINVAAVLEAPAFKDRLPELLKKYGALAFEAALEAEDIKDEAAVKLVKAALGDAEANGKYLEQLKARFQRIQLGTSGANEEDDFLVVVEGRFDPAWLKGWMDWAGKNKFLGWSVEEVKLGKRPAYRLKGGEEGELFVVLVAETTILAGGSRKDLEAALERAGKKEEQVNKNLLGQARQIDAACAVWAVMAPAEEADLAGYHAGLRLDRGVRGEVAITVKDAGVAADLSKDIKETLAGSVKALKDLAGPFKQITALLEIAEKVEPKAEGNVIRIRGEIPAELVRKLLADLP